MKWVYDGLVTLRPAALRQKGESSKGVESESESESRLDKKNRKKINKQIVF